MVVRLLESEIEVGRGIPRDLTELNAYLLSF